jgi:hypothetical protein
MMNETDGECLSRDSDCLNSVVSILRTCTMYVKRDLGLTIGGLADKI